MEGGHAIQSYQFGASFRDGVVEWAFALKTDDGKQHVLRIRDGEEVPVLHALVRGDSTVYFDAKSQTLRTGWNTPGKQ